MFLNPHFTEVFVISKRALINGEIRAREVRVIDNGGKQLGILKIDQALRMAENLGLDLVEIAPGSKPPVCKIMDYGKFRFEREKKEKENRKKQQTFELKELQLTCNIAEHDFMTKVGHANRFLSQGNKVKVMVKFRGREMAHTERGMALAMRFAEACGETGQPEKTPVMEGRNMIMILNPLKVSAAAKAKDSNAV